MIISVVTPVEAEKRLREEIEHRFEKRLNSLINQFNTKHPKLPCRLQFHDLAEFDLLKEPGQALLLSELATRLRAAGWPVSDCRFEHSGWLKRQVFVDVYDSRTAPTVEDLSW
jgi:hypothetical protein